MKEIESPDRRPNNNCRSRNQRKKKANENSKKYNKTRIVHVLFRHEKS